VTQDRALVDERPEHLVQVKVRATQPGGGDADDGVGGLLDDGVRMVVDPHVALAVPGQSFHLWPLPD
jgi:hypothetical protein